MTIEQQLLACTELISIAAETGDRETLAGLLHDRFEMRLTDGRVFDKSGTIGLWTSPQAHATNPTHEIADAHVAVYGAVGLVVAVVTDRWSDDDGLHEYRERIFDVWCDEDGRWQLIASHPVKIEAEHRKEG